VLGVGGGAYGVGMIEVRQAGPTDAGALGEIHAAAWEAAYAPFFTPDFAVRAAQDRLGRWHRLIADSRLPVLLGALDGRPLVLSYCVPSETRPGLAEIYSFYGHPDGWGTGVAPALMSGTLAMVRDNGFARVHLWTLRDTPQSRRFYAKCGFVETGATTIRDFGDGNPLAQVEYERSVNSAQSESDFR
jgi:GNAT superfamily N-acetyltransferase